MNYYPDITYFVLNSEEKLNLEDIEKKLSEEFSILKDYDQRGYRSTVKFEIKREKMIVDWGSNAYLEILEEDHYIPEEYFKKNPNCKNLQFLQLTSSANHYFTYYPVYVLVKIGLLKYEYSNLVSNEEGLINIKDYGSSMNKMITTLDKYVINSNEQRLEYYKYDGKIVKAYIENTIKTHVEK